MNKYRVNLHPAEGQSDYKELKANCACEAAELALFDSYLPMGIIDVIVENPDTRIITEFRLSKLR